MILIESQLLRLDQPEPSLIEYPSEVKKLFVKGDSSRNVPSQNLEIITKTFTTDSIQYFSSVDVEFREL